MAKKSSPKKRTPKKKKKAAWFKPWRWLFRGAIAFCVLVVLLVLVWGTVNPPTTLYMMSEKRRIGSVDQHWIPMDEIAPVMARSAVAAEDANFCLHFGFDVEAIRDAIEDGGTRGASTISQQVVKNVFLWHGRSWIRKVLEAAITPLMEALWSKRRILEVYLNVAEFDEGVFGVEAASRHYFGIGPESLSATQAARLAAILPNPKNRSASRPSSFVQRRASQIRSGAATIRADGRAKCFED